MFKRLLIFLLLALVVWAAAVFWPERANKPVGGNEFAWPEFTLENIREIGIRSEGRSFTLAKREEGWFVDIPGREPDLRADREKVEALVEFISINKPKSSLGEPSEHKAYGLGEPRAEVNVGGKAHLVIGAENPTGDGVYALVKGWPQMLLLPREYGSRLTRKPEYYFDMDLFGLREEDIVSVALQTPGDKAWKIAVRGEEYVFEEPESRAGAPVSRQEMELYMHTLVSAKAAGMMFDEPSGAVEELAHVTIEAKNRSETLVLLAVQDGLAGRSDYQPTGFRLDQELRDKLMKSAFELTDRRILDLDLSKITTLTISRGERKVTAVRADSAWKLKGGDSRELLGIDMNLWRLTDLKYEFEPVESLPDSARHALTLTLINKQADPIEGLDFYVDPGLAEGLCWIATADRDAYYPVSAQLYKDLAGLLPPTESEDR